MLTWFAIDLAYSSICRVHEALRVTPAMEAGLTKQVWSLAKLVALSQARMIEAA